MIVNPVVVDMDIGGVESIDMDVGSSIIVHNAYQEKTATPTEETQIIGPDVGFDALSQITIEPIPTNYGRITRIGSRILVS